MKSVMRKNYGNSPSINVPRSTFDRSHGVKTTFDSGKLIPIFVDQSILPGDTVHINMTGFARLSTPIYPVMDNMFLETFWFSVPWRQVWTNSVKFFGEQEDPGDSIDYTIPQLTYNNAGDETVYDYFGLPTNVGADISVNALAFRAMHHIWNNWFRDENLQDSLTVDKSDGPDTTTYNVLSRNKRSDYFTRCLPFLQKGDAVVLSLGESAPITGIGRNNQTFTASSVASYETDASASTTYVSAQASSTTNALYVEEDPNNTGYPNIRADLASATASTINELRQAVQVQHLLEADARCGTRYPEILQSRFGVTDPQMSVLQRPEFLGSGSTPINITPIARTEGAPGTTGQLGAMATAAFRNHGFTKSFTEHSIIIGFANVRADITYQEGIECDWFKQTRYDTYHPELAMLGEKSVLNKEIYVDATTIGAGTDENVFGYQERWSEYRTKKSYITGKLRSGATGSLDAWHLGIEFGAQPTLDDTFIVDAPPVDRVIATPTQPHFIFDSYIKYIHTRPIPTYSIPNLVSRF